MLEYTLYVQETWARLLELFALHFCLSMYTLCQLSTLGPRAFSVAGPLLWNSTRQLDRSRSWQGQLQTFAKDAFIYTVLYILHIRYVSGQYGLQIDLLTYLLISSQA